MANNTLKCNPLVWAKNRLLQREHNFNDESPTNDSEHTQIWGHFSEANAANLRLPDLNADVCDTAAS